MGMRAVIDGKKQWRAYRARVAALPPDYRIVHTEIEKYLLGIDGTPLPGILEFFEAGAARGTPVRDLVGSDIAAFCDDALDDRTGSFPTSAREHAVDVRSLDIEHR